MTAVQYYVWLVIKTKCITATRGFVITVNDLYTLRLSYEEWQIENKNKTLYVVLFSLLQNFET